MDLRDGSAIRFRSKMAELFQRSHSLYLWLQVYDNYSCFARKWRFFRLNHRMNRYGLNFTRMVRMLGPWSAIDPIRQEGQGTGMK